MLHTALLAGTLAAFATSLPLPPAQGDGFSPDAVLLRTPDVSATQVVFRYAGDLWLSPREGGSAVRLTSAEGAESLPKFSPDGKSVAFMADYDGGSDIYVVGVEGGTPRRVTWHPGRETLCDWHPSGDSLLFFSSEESGIARAPRIFRVSVEGGQPVPLPVPYGTFCSLAPDGKRLAYTPLSREGRTWRRYRGGMAQDIWLYDLEANTSTRVTDDPGTDRMPMWAGDELLFQSDRGERGIANLYAYDPASGETRALTSLATSGARFPSVGPLDVVFEQGGALFRYEIATGDIVRIAVSIPGDRPALRPVAIELGGAVQGQVPTRTGKRIVMEARGEVFSVPVDEGITRNLTRTSDAAERTPSPSPDGRFVAYWSDAPGEYELFVRHLDGTPLGDGSAARQLTRTGGDWKARPHWSPDSKRIAWSNQNGELRWIDVALGLDVEPVLAGATEVPRFVDVHWSPDSSWLAWSARSSRTRLEALYLYDVEARKLHEITSGLFDDSDPVFSGSGKWLFFHSARHFEPSYADLDSTWIYDGSRVLMVVPLAADTELPWAPENVEEEGGIDDAEEGSDEGDAEPSDDGPGAAVPARTVIDLEGLEARIARVPVDPGIAPPLIPMEDGVLFGRADEEDDVSLYLFAMDAADDDAERVVGPVDDAQLSADGEHLLVVSEERTYVVAPKPGQTLEDPVSFAGVRGVFDPREEWPQMIRDVYRMYRDWFYDEGLHGVDWAGERDRMLSALKDATSREDVHFLIGEMISELNVGHAYNRGPRGGFGGASDVAPVGLLGADWRPAAGGRGFELVRLVGSGAETDGRGPLHGKARAGDVLVAVDGVPVDPARSVHASLRGTAGRTVQLTFVRDGDEREVLARALTSETDLRYRDWVEEKRRYVHAATDGAIGYVHVPDTGVGGQTELYRQFLAERGRRALIVDERWNGGGQIPTRFIELLSRKRTNAWAMRDGKTFDWPEVAHDGPKVMLINHSSGSGGDAFPWYFRQAGLGKLIGTRTWGGLVGISGNPALVDGASPTVPSFGFFELDGTWAVEGHGVDPDIEVVDDPALMQGGQDPQLDRAIAELRAAMETWPYADVARPASPNRRGAGVPESDR